MFFMWNLSQIRSHPALIVLEKFHGKQSRYPGNSLKFFWLICSYLASLMANAWVNSPCLSQEINFIVIILSAHILFNPIFSSGLPQSCLERIPAVLVMWLSVHCHQSFLPISPLLGILSPVGNIAPVSLSGIKVLQVTYSNS